MEKFETKKEELKIENIKIPEVGEISVCPERGGIITSLKFGDKEILYMDEETLNNKEVNIKGGIPILFPNAGPIPDEIKTEETKNLKQHGFARDSKWSFKKTDKGFEQKLFSDEKTKEVYPYDFIMTMTGQFNKDGSFSIFQIIENTGKNDMPISSGFHPYFKVPSQNKKDIKFNFKEGDQIINKIDIWANGKAVSIEKPDDVFEVEIPELGVLEFEASKEYHRLWIWSQENKDFVCVEPVMQDKGGIINNPEVIKTGEKLELFFNIKLKS